MSRIFADFLKVTNLPYEAKIQLPKMLSEQVQGILLKKDDDEKILNSAIDGINHGSIQTEKSITLKKLRYSH